MAGSPGASGDSIPGIFTAPGGNTNTSYVLPVPSITSATYDADSGVLRVTAAF